MGGALGGAALVAGQHARRRRALHRLGRGWGLVAQPKNAQGREVILGRRWDLVQLFGRAVGQLLQVLVLQFRGLGRSQRLHQVARALLLRGEIGPQPLELRHPQHAAPLRRPCAVLRAGPRLACPTRRRPAPHPLPSKRPPPAVGGKGFSRFPKRSANEVGTHNSHDITHLYSCR